MHCRLTAYRLDLKMEGMLGYIKLLHTEKNIPAIHAAACNQLEILHICIARLTVQLMLGSIFLRSFQAGQIFLNPHYKRLKANGNFLDANCQQRTLNRFSRLFLLWYAFICHHYLFCCAFTSAYSHHNDYISSLTSI